jgi:bifunctional DNA-binding transcriptional regulator/antitoxin component of YhaV-PrlF toxin-antitoxin module
MRIAIDGVGRLVVPKPLRDELGIAGPTELDVVARDGVIELTVAEVPAHVEERDGWPVISVEAPVAPMDAEEVRAAIDRVRR